MTFLRKAAVLLTLLLCPGEIAHSGEYQFQHLGVADGLSSNSITSIYQDRRGFLWIGTLDGLNRYDGYQFTVFRHDIQDSTSLSSNRILSIFEDRAGSLWVGTEDAGLNRLDRATGKFYRYVSRPSDPGSISWNQVESIFEDRSGILWTGTKKGLNRLDRKTGKFFRYTHVPSDSSSLGHDHIGALFEDADGTLWIGGGEYLHRFNPDRGNFTRFHPTIPFSQGEPIIGSIVEEPRGTLWISTWGSGLWKFDTATGQFTVFRHDPRNSGSLGLNEIGHLSLDGAGNLWIGTQDGLDLLRKGSGEFLHFRHDIRDKTSISANGIWPLFRDRSGVLWIGTYRGGLNKLTPSRMIAAHYTSDPGNPNSLSDNSVLTIFEDRNHIIWIGTTHGLNRFDRKTGRFTVYHKRPGGLNSEYINAIWEDEQGIIWIGTNGNGLTRFDPENGTFRSYRANPGDPTALNNDWVYRIISDGGGKVLIGTQGGLNRFDPETGRFDNISSIIGNAICTALYLEKGGAIWFGSNRGLSQYDPRTKRITRFASSPYDSTTLSNNYIRTITEDSDGTLWIGTVDGLNRFDRKSGRFFRYTRRNGLANESINDIEGDRDGYLWICTNAGLSRFDPHTGAIRNFGFRNGMPFQVFDESCMLKTKDGNLLVGGQEGFFMFRPESFRTEGQPPPVAVTGFRIFNREVKLDRPIWETNRITLTHRDTFFSFELAALDYTAPEQNQYAYRMEGFDRDWNYTDSRRYASYTNLHPGKYVFRVKAANGDGVWNERGSAIEVVILPPLWETWWFRALCFLVLSGLALGFHLLRVTVIKRQKKRLENLVTERTHELEERTGQLEQSERLHRSLVETYPDAILVSDMNGAIRMANPQAASMLEAGNVESLLGHSLLDFLQPEDREQIRSLWGTLTKTGDLKNITLSLNRLSGSSLPVELNALVFIDRGQPRVMGILRDITVRKRMEEERVERERMRGVLETAGGACHELNQPLQVAVGYTEILSMSEGIDASERSDIIRKIHHEMRRMAEITRKLNNITAYRTKEYAGGTRIIDLARASGNTDIFRKSQSEKHSDKSEE